MSLINLVNKFCLKYNFLPCQLNKVSSSTVIVRYDEINVKEFNKFADLICQLQAVTFNTTVFTKEYKIVITRYR